MEMMANNLGTPTQRFAWILGPMGGNPPGRLRAQVDGLDPKTGQMYMQEVLDAWTLPLTAGDTATGPTYTEQTWPDTMTGTEGELVEEFHRQRWTDYQPIVLPTEERVEAMLQNTSHDPDEIVDRYGASQRNKWDMSVRCAAINAVMFGITWDMFPAFLTLQAKGGCRSSSTSSAGQCAFFNGPIRHQLNIPMETGCMSYLYNRFGSLMGRAWGMATCNIMGGAKQDDNYQGNLGSPSNDLPVVFAEREEALPSGWNPHHVQRGFNLSDSTVSTVSTREIGCAMTLRDDWEWMLKHTLRISAVGFNKSSATIFMNPNPVQGFLREGFDTKEKLSEWVMNNVGIPKYHYFEHQGVINYQIQSAIDRTDDKLAHWYYDLADDDMVYPYTRIDIVMAGGSKNIRWHHTDGGAGSPGLVSDWA